MDDDLSGVRAFMYGALVFILWAVGWIFDRIRGK